MSLALPSPRTDVAFTILLTLSALLNIGLWAYIAARFSNLPPLVPIHFSSARQADRFGPPADFFILPVIGLIALAGNSLICALAYRRDRAICYVLHSFSLSVQLLLFISALRLVH